MAEQRQAARAMLGVRVRVGGWARGTVTRTDGRRYWVRTDARRIVGPLTRGDLFVLADQSQPRAVHA
jgi:hypothetical protein